MLYLYQNNKIKHIPGQIDLMEIKNAGNREESAMKTEEMMPFLKQLAKGIATQFGPQCEVAVHDLTKGTDGTIAVIENGHVTGRSVGGSASEIVLEALKDPTKIEDQLDYLTRTQDGRLLKSSSIYMKDDEGKVIALFSINYDITAISHATSIMSQFINTSRDKREERNGVETIFSNVNDLLDNLIEESNEYVGKPVAMMSKEDKIKAIHYLDKKGAFLIKKAGDKVSRYYDISKYTLYNYMDAQVDEQN